MEPTIKEYDARLDSKKRLTLRGAKTMYYRVREKEDGTIELSPRVLVHPEAISQKTLTMIDKSIDQLKKGNASGPVDLEELNKLLD
ncbi:MAG: hypothetical protein LAT75_11435 [Candidatus Cyclonatronum sp.]|uniref:hypothetical protein n=1 Tax=Cyclonatronum sp. TaxID=3024185 RepID=UPI0025BEA03E|nr:hypothetical protein [Cyclonatronum sp.]MCH8487469.1 hypothetical protein [Cyclonatronum sp.]